MLRMCNIYTHTFVHKRYVYGGDRYMYMYIGVGSRMAGGPWPPNVLTSTS